MKVSFDFNIPAENMTNGSTDAFIQIDAEVMNPGLSSEVAFIKNVKADQKILIGMIGSDQLFTTICKVACEHANIILEDLDESIRREYSSGKGNARYIGDLTVNNSGRVDAVTIAEEVLK